MAKKMKTMARQGDVLIISLEHKKLKPETKARLFGMKLEKAIDFKTENRIPLAYGEVSGHAHAIYSQNAMMFVNKDVQETVKHLKTTDSAVVQHEEHEAIEIPQNLDAVVLIQNEYRLNKIQRVVD